MTLFKAAVGSALALAMLGPVGPAGAQTQTTLLAARIRAQTPSCDKFPNAPVVGRVTGLAGADPTRTLSFVGCFPSFAACEAWRGPVSGAVSRRMILNTCEKRK